MSLKENLSAIKQEISTEEQFLESVIKGERFFKKYKKIIIAGVVSLILIGVGYSAYGIIHDRNLKASNEAYEVLLKNPDNKEALDTLKSKNPALYTAFEFQRAIKSANKEELRRLSSLKDNSFISDLSRYELAQLDNSKNIESDLLKGFVLLEEGYDLLKEGKIKEAKLKFSQISPDSGLSTIAKNLSHYQGK